MKQIIKASLLDRMYYSMESESRPLDFVISLKLSEAPPSEEALYRGARAARQKFPRTACVLRKNKGQLEWVDASSLRTPMVRVQGVREREIAEFIYPPINLKEEWPVRQMLLRDVETGGFEIVTRVHHAAGDFMSAMMWLECQLSVAWGMRSPETRQFALGGPKIRTHSKPVTRSKFGRFFSSEPLWTKRESTSARRAWRTIQFAKFHRSPGQGEPTYNDLLLSITMDLIDEFQRDHKKDAKAHLGVWIPINIRESGSREFGNGTSRIRVYNDKRLKATQGLIDRGSIIREQIEWSKKKGEWHVPQASRAMPFAIRLKKPWFDRGSVLFSHTDRLGGSESRKRFPMVKGVEVISQLYEEHPLSVMGTTYAGQTTLTFTYDPIQLDAYDVEQMARRFLWKVSESKELLSKQPGAPETWIESQ